MHARRALAIVVATGTALLGSPLVSGAGAATTFEPAFGTSAFIVNGDPVSFPAVAARSGHVVQLPSLIKVAFTAPIKFDQAGNGLTVPDSAAAAPYFFDPDAPDAHIEVGSWSLDPSDDTQSTMRVTPPNGLADGTYELHVSAFDAETDACPDATVLDITRPACTQYDDVVHSSGTTPFDFTVDSQGPSVTITKPVSSDPAIDADHVEDVDVAGVTDAETASMELRVKSSGAAGTRLIPVSLGAPSNGIRHWTANDDLHALADGTLTFTALGTDVAGNETDPGSEGATSTVVLRAHPSVPRSVAAKSGDGAVKVTWAKPSSTGGHPITGYVLRAVDKTDSAAAAVFAQASCQSTCPTSKTIGNLTNGHSYTIAIAAVTNVGRGAVAFVNAHPKAATTVTIKSSDLDPKSGETIRLSGRLTRTLTASGIENVKVTITPVFTDGSKGDPVTATTGTFGFWHKKVVWKKAAKYVVRWAGDGATRASQGHVLVPRPQQGALPHTG